VSAPDAASSTEAQALVQAIFAACGEGRADDAESGWEQLQALEPLPPLAAVIPAFIMMCRGRHLDALQYMNGLPEDFSPETRALCLRQVGDPTWESIARELLEDADPDLREGAQQMLAAGA
jgi:hypothetical protein